ncbi:SAVED domain-containing protein [Ancylobacter sp.]|uniref:SAVED domain-containing protein n=1 Tax=Ancylobacter sp. TaxID=1872567 RepID=UPI003C7D61C7
MKRLLDLFEHFIRSAIDYVFRVRSPGLGLVGTGGVIITAALAGWAFNLSFPFNGGLFALSFSVDGPGRIVMYAVLLLGATLVAVGLRQLQKEFAASARLRAIVIELRGLRDWIGAPLSESVPRSIRGRKEEIILDLRKGADGQVMPDLALAELHALRPRINTIEKGLDRRDVTYVVGALAPVPFTFLLGVLVDDEGPIALLDWDRHKLAWRELESPDDGKRFSVIGLDAACGGHASVAVAISASYIVDVAGVHAKLGTGVPLVHLELDGASTDANWSEVKQQELARRFLEVMVRLGNSGVQQVHLFFAGPNSLVMRFGMAYDKRNLPALTLYQYERGHSPPHPWGVAMPVAGLSLAEIIS